MDYLGVQCKSCGREFAVERVEKRSNAVAFSRPSFKASYTCPHCDQTHDYTSQDLEAYQGEADGEPD